MDATGPSTTQPGARRSPPLASAGAMMLAAALLMANPFFGASSTSWPWEVLARARSPLLVANWLVWLGAGLLAVVLGLRGRDTWRGTVLAALALLLGFTCHSKLAGLRIEENSLAVNAGISLLMAGFLLQAWGLGDRAARVLSALGGLLVVWTLACAFDYPSGAPPRSQLVVKVHDLVSRLVGGDVLMDLPNYDEHLASAAALLLASALGMLALLGVRGRLSDSLGVVMLVATFAIRPVCTFSRVVAAEGFDAVTFARHVSEVLVTMGMAWCVFMSVVIVDLAQDRRDASGGAA